MGFASVDLENEDESESGCEGYGCDNAPGYGAPSPNYGPPAPTYDEPIGSGADSMLNSVSILKILQLGSDSSLLQSVSTQSDTL